MSEEKEQFEFAVAAKAMPDGIQTSTRGSGEPESGDQFQEALINIAIRSLATLYESWLLGTGRENTAEARAFFFADHQPLLFRGFMGMGTN